MKKIFFNIIGVIFTLVLCFTPTTTTFAGELQKSPITTITVADENGEDISYTVYENTLNSIPIYAKKTGEDNTRNLSQVATLTINLNKMADVYTATFHFKPSNIGTTVLAIGFTGEFTTYKTGMTYGSGTYILPVMSGTIGAPQHGTGSLSGTYSVVGFDPVRILQSFSW